MYPARRLYPFRRSARRGGTWLLPWVFVLGIAAGTMLPAVRDWHRGRVQVSVGTPEQADPAGAGYDRSDARGDAGVLQSRAVESGGRLAAEVMYTIDGDTFAARVRLGAGDVMRTRVRLRGIDAPELRAACAEEYRMARAAGTALRELLAEGGVTIFNVGPDKYRGRVVADVATARTANVSEALFAAGHARRYHGGHRDGWCG